MYCPGGEGLNEMKQYGFYPRIINPLRLSRAIVFSADEEVRKASQSLIENMPWTAVEALNDPVSVSNYKSEQALSLIHISEPTRPY